MRRREFIAGSIAALIAPTPKIGVIFVNPALTIPQGIVAMVATKNGWVPIK